LPNQKIFQQIIDPIQKELSEKPRVAARYGGAEGLHNRAMEYLGGFYTQFNENLYVSFARQCRETLFPTLFTMIQSHELIPGTIDMIKGPLASGPVVFNPNHDSNLDAMMHGIFFNQSGINHPKITAGANLCKASDGSADPEVTATLKALNAVVVDRTLLARDLLYLKLFKEYYLHTLRSGENHCFYIESGRSYSGSIKVGAVSAMLNWTLETGLPLLSVVPVGVSYTRIFEDRKLFRCHATGEKMAETNLMKEFATGSAVLGTNSPVHLTVAPPILIRRIGEKVLLDPLSAPLALTEDIDLETAMEISLAEVKEMNSAFTQPGQTLHDMVYEGMLSARPVLAHYVVSRAISDALKKQEDLNPVFDTEEKATDKADDTESSKPVNLPLNIIEANVQNLLEKLTEMGRNCRFSDSSICLKEGIGTLIAFGAIAMNEIGKTEYPDMIDVLDPNLCTFYGNKVPLFEP
jgi:1-acyl-sn-glycerol-3-phosphate acyltransferase